MLIYLPTAQHIITASYDAGDKLTTEDKADGFADYLMTSLYSKAGEKINHKDTGQLLSATPFNELDPGDIVERLLDYWEIEPRGDFVVAETELI